MATARQRTVCKLPTKPYTVVLEDPATNRPVYIGTTKSARAAMDDFERQVGLELNTSGKGGSWVVTLYEHTPETRVNSITSAGDPDGRNHGKPYLISVTFPGSRIVQQSTPATRDSEQ